MVKVTQGSRPVFDIRLPKKSQPSGRGTIPTLEERIEEAREHARMVTETRGAVSAEAAAAWDVVEELLAEAAHQRAKKPKTNFDLYCEEYPDALEARIFDV
ncbi:Calvin cycle protein CP12 [Kamptonema formosum]|uniref:Calvin cycle protein CP12 n=1 Tax=Kamptonema formosum TaxID=331992 RepID=UPI00037C9577|nr:Calvin cycle protein CP12 [Oscillatoria sp. PCC 10802]